MDSQINLRWNSHKSTVFSMFDTLLSTETMVDVTLACEGKYVRAHKVVLSACSSYFQEILTINGDQSPILYLRGVKHSELKALIEYMYRGEVSVSHSELSSFLEIAKDLKIRGLADVSPSSSSSAPNSEMCEDLYNPSNSNSHYETPSPIIRSSNIPSASPFRADEIPSSKTLLPRKKPKMDHRRHRAHAQQFKALDVGQPAPDFAQPRTRTHSRSPKLTLTNPLVDTIGMPHLQSLIQIQTESATELEMIEDESFNSPDDAGKLLKLEVQEGYTLGPEIIELEDNCDNTVHESELWDHDHSSTLSSSAAFTSNSSSVINPIDEKDEVATTSRTVRVEGSNPPKHFEDNIQNRHKRSSVWQHFTTVGSEEEGDNEFYSQCNYCYKKYKRSTSTTNMKSHLNISHQLFF